MNNVRMKGSDGAPAGGKQDSVYRSTIRRLSQLGF